MRFKVLQDPRYLLDGLVDCVAVGLYELGHQVRLPSHKSYLTGRSELPPAFECFTSNIVNYTGNEHDVCIVALPYSGPLTGPYIVLDGRDTTDIDYQYLRGCLAYFKRERATQHPPMSPLTRASLVKFAKHQLMAPLLRPHQDKIFPLALSTLVEPVDTPMLQRQWDAGYIGSDRYGRASFIDALHSDDLSNYIRTSSYYMADSDILPMSAYLDIVRRCRAFLCLHGAGEDTYRVWETLACGTIPLLQEFTIEVTHDFTHGENALIFDDVDSLLDCLDVLRHHDTTGMSENALRFFKSYHTPQHRARYVL